MKNRITQFSLIISALMTITFLMSYVKPSAEEPREYTVVSEMKIDNLQKQVNQKLSEGWHLQGGINVYGQNHYQAMAK